MLHRGYVILNLLLLMTHIAHAEVLFEGYYKVNQFKKHIGFFIAKYEIDEKSKQFKSTTFLKLGKNGVDLTESLQAISDLDFKPLKYTYMALDSKRSKTIDAEIKDNSMSGLITENSEKKKFNTRISKDSFLSSSLYYKMLRSKEGLKTGVTYKFSAIAEEQAAEVTGGLVQIDSKMISKGALQLLKANINFLGPEYENLISNQGQIFSAFTAATSIDVELVKSSAEATEGIKVSANTLEKLFGTIPDGKINLLNIK